MLRLGLKIGNPLGKGQKCLLALDYTQPGDIRRHLIIFAMFKAVGYVHRIQNDTGRGPLWRRGYIETIIHR